MKQIPLTRGHVALVDDEDYDALSKHKWCVSVPSTKRWLRKYKVYAVRAIGKGRKERMHRVILNAPAGMVVDHRNGNTLDNRRCNLRVTTQSRNASNSEYVPGATGFRGVYLSTPARKNRRYVARFSVKDETIYLGCFATALEAARAYDEAARRVLGDFARLNFPNENEMPAFVASEGVEL